jgi:hypothetical protein
MHSDQDSRGDAYELLSYENSMRLAQKAVSMLRPMRWIIRPTLLARADEVIQ